MKKENVKIFRPSLLKTIILPIVVLITLSLNVVIAEETEELSLDEQIVAIKAEMVDLGQAIKSLEDILLYPPENKLAVYLSMDVGLLFDLDTLRLHINNELIAEYEYSDREETGLSKGAAQKLFIGNYMPGKYNLRAIFTGVGPHGRPYKRALSHQFTKSKLAKVLKLVVYDNVHKQQPEFLVEDVKLCKACF